MEGYLLIDKPTGWTSFDVVKFVRNKVAAASGVSPKRIKVGHSGTLDPFASGLLIILVGKRFTTMASQLLKQDKTYEVEMELDSSSSTGDPEGTIIKQSVSVPKPTVKEIKTALAAFPGDIMQVPPVFSAIKVNGTRAYKLARSQQPVELKARPVSIRSLCLSRYDYPDVWFTTKVSSGTYIRSLVEDIGKALGRSAYTKNLRRTTIGIYSNTNAYSINQISEHTIKEQLKTDL